MQSEMSCALREQTEITNAAQFEMAKHSSFVSVWTESEVSTGDWESWKDPGGALLIHADLLLSRTAKVKSLMRIGRH